MVDIIKEGWLEKRSRHLKKWRRRWTVLTSTYLATFKEERMYLTATEKIAVIDFRNLGTSEDEIGIQHTFRLDTAKGSFYFKADSYVEKEMWLGCLGRTVVMREG
jgi:hypothetical protein